MATDLDSDFPRTGWRRATSVEIAVKQEAGLVIEAWMATSDDGRRWLVTCGEGERGERHVNATLRQAVGHRYLAREVAERILDAARSCAN